MSARVRVGPRQFDHPSAQQIRQLELQVGIRRHDLAHYQLRQATESARDPPGRRWGGSSFPLHLNGSDNDSDLGGT